MQLHPSTRKLLDALQSFSQNKLSRREDLGILIELATRHDMHTALDDLSFLAKFLHKTYGLMHRIGKDSDGYEKLSREFGENLEKAATLVRTLIENGPEEVTKRFTSEYLGLRADALENFLELMYNLSWYKNWLIDHPQGSF